MTKKAERSTKTKPTMSKWHLLSHYLLLFLLVLTGGLAATLLENSLFRWAVLASLVALYIIWGVWHHYEDKTLSHQVVLEYVGIALLVGVILMLVSQ